MKKSLLSLLAFGMVWAGGFKLNEHSLNSIALSSAYVAGANGADSALYNPANMGFGKFADKNEIEISTTWLYIPKFSFTTDYTKFRNEIGRDQGTSFKCKGGSCWLASLGIPSNVKPGPSSAEGSAKATSFVFPELFYKSATFWGGFNVGLAFTAPSGMTLDWDGEGGKFLDNIFIAMVEANPTLSFKITDWFAIGGGGRVVYGMGQFQNSLYVPYEMTEERDLGWLLGKIQVTSKGTTAVDQSSSTKDIGYGYNVATTLKPIYFWTDSLTLSATYRSAVHLDLKGKLKAKARTGSAEKPIITADMDADLTLSTDIPPVFQVGLAQQLGSFLLEFVYERTFWSYGDKFEFNYKNQKFSNIGGSQAGQLGKTEEQRAEKIQDMMDGADYDSVAIGRGWKDTNSYRLGLTYGVDEKLRVMASVAYDETPVPNDAFGIPDAKAYMMGAGARYSFLDDLLDVGVAYSLTLKDNRNSPVQSNNGLGKLQLVNASIACRF